MNTLFLHEKFVNKKVLLFIALVVCNSILLVVNPLATLAQAKPDAYVSAGSIAKETSLVKGTVEKIEVAIGNQSNVAPLPNVHYTAFMGVVTSTGQAVCEIHATYNTLAPNSSFKVFQFQVAYPSPITQAVPKQSMEPRGSQPGGTALPLKEVGPIAKNFAQYTLITRVWPTVLCPQADSNCANNQLTRTFQFPAGGTPSCVKLQ